MYATLSHTLSKIDVLALTETFLSQAKMQVNSFSLPDYQVLEKHRGSGQGGGILCYVRKDYRVEPLCRPT